MTVDELINHLYPLDPTAEVILFADQEGLTTMTPESVSYQTNYRGQRVVLISAWEPDGHEPL